MSKLWYLSLLALCICVCPMVCGESCGDVDCYDVLKVTQRASFVEIKESYKKLSRQYHPDKNPGVSEDKFKIIARAYEILSDPRKRERYDYAIRNPMDWADEDGYFYNAESGNLDYRIISICLGVCCLIFVASAKWVTQQDFWNPPQIKSKKKKNTKKI